MWRPNDFALASDKDWLGRGRQIDMAAELKVNAVVVGQIPKCVICHLRLFWI